MFGKDVSIEKPEVQDWLEGAVLLGDEEVKRVNFLAPVEGVEFGGVSMIPF